MFLFSADQFSYIIKMFLDLLRLWCTPVFLVQVSHSKMSKGGVVVEVRSYSHTKPAGTLIHLHLFLKLCQLMLLTTIK